MYFKQKLGYFCSTRAEERAYYARLEKFFADKRDKERKKRGLPPVRRPSLREWDLAEYYN